MVLIVIIFAGIELKEIGLELEMLSSMRGGRKHGAKTRVALEK